MAYDPQMRASDEDRDRTAALLREHHALGRLTPEEFSERLDAALVAKTMGDLDKLLKDLPSVDLYRLPDAKLTKQPIQAQPQRHGHESARWRAAWGSWLSVTLVCIVVWALSGFGYPWWLWVAGPWGACLAGGYLTFSLGRAGRRQLRGGPGRGELPGGPDSR